MPQATPHRGEHLVLIDGVCGLCNRLAAFVLPRDGRHMFDFASLQSEAGRSALRRFGRSPEALDTFYIITNYRTSSPALLDKTVAAFFLAETLGGPWACLRPFSVLPTGLLNHLYDFVARHRYRFFGRYETCPMPSPDYKDRFVDV